jgi:LuxR family maltose regulon positive regulatory protein
MANRPVPARQPLLITKISPPLIPAVFVQRQRLIDRLNQGVRRPLVLVNAPAGFGKTNLLVDWFQQSAWPAAWLTLDAEDNDLTRLFRYLIYALQQIKPDLGAETLDLIQSTRASGIEMGLTLLINELSALSEHLVLVLDEFHQLSDPELLQAINYLLKHQPANLHLILAGRGEPQLELAPLRAYGQLSELTADDLRFTKEEMLSFFNANFGLKLSPETLQALEERTDGWITALQMASLSLSAQPDPEKWLSNLHGDARYLVDYLGAEVFNRLPEDIRAFLLRSAILEDMNGRLCEAVVNPEALPGYGAVMLERLARANLFVYALDDRHEWFRYHRLFADFLRHLLTEQAADEISILNKRAAEWFRQAGNLDTAFQYALASQDMPYAAEFIQLNLPDLLRSGELSSLTHWISKLPPELIRRSPALSLAYAWGLIAAYQLDMAYFWLDALERTLTNTQANLIPLPTGIGDNDFNLAGGLAICRSTLALINGDVQKSAAYSREALNCLENENPFSQSLLALENSVYYIYAGDTNGAIQALQESVQLGWQSNNLLVLIVATCQIAEMQAIQGHLSQALATLEKARLMTRRPDGQDLPLSAVVDISVGEIYRERGQLDQARELLERGCAAARNFWSLSSLDGMISLVRVYQAQGEHQLARQWLQMAAQMALSTESSQWDDVYVTAMEIRLAVQRGDHTAAWQLWQQSGFSTADAGIVLEKYPYQVYEYLLLTQARFYLMVGQERHEDQFLKQAVDSLCLLLPQAKRFERLSSQIEIELLLALIHQARGEFEQCAQHLNLALAQAESEGFRRIFLDEGDAFARALALTATQPAEYSDYLPSQAFIQSLRQDLELPLHARMNPDMPFRFPELPPAAELSLRELEVLKLLAEGKSNQEISLKLCLALNTVKRHIYNIYSKLDVNKRTQAVARARQLGIID